MGVSGYKPWDSDQASDLIDGRILVVLGRELKRAVSKSPRVRRYHYESARAAALTIHALWDAGWHIEIEQLKAARNALAVMREDKTWIDDWAEPKKILSELYREIAALDAQIKIQDMRDASWARRMFALGPGQWPGDKKAPSIRKKV